MSETVPERPSTSGPDAPEAPRGAAPPPSPGPHYGPVHRYASAPSELRDGSATTPSRSGYASTGPPPAWPPSPVPAPRTSSGTSYAPWSPVAPPPWGPASRRADHASWSRRVAAAVLDALPGWVAYAVLVTGYLPTYLGLVRGDLSARPNVPLVLVGTLLSLAAFGFVVYNRYVRAGRTGQSVGKRATGIWLVSQTTGRPVGAFNAFVRDLLHVLDGFGYVGYLWPLWDDERQTLADKVAQTLVVRTPVPPLTELERRRG